MKVKGETATEELSRGIRSCVSGAASSATASFYHTIRCKRAGEFQGAHMLNKMLLPQSEGQKSFISKRMANTKQPRLTTQRHANKHASIFSFAPLFSFFSSIALQINRTFD